MKDILILVILALGLAGILGFLVGQTDVINWMNNPIIKSTNTSWDPTARNYSNYEVKIIEIQGEDKLQNMTAEIQKIISNASNRTSKLTYPDRFDCTDFSRESVRQLIEKGYDARCIFGNLKTEEGWMAHDWVELKLSYEYNDGTLVTLMIPIDAVNGEFIGYEDYKQNYKPTSWGECI